MTVIEISKRTGIANRKRPTVATPVLREEQINKALAEIDENIELLNCVHLAMNGSEQVTDGMIEALQGIHNRLRRLTDGLFMAM